MVDYETVVNELINNYPDALAVAVIDESGNIAYQTDNWDISEDLSRLLSSWRGGSAQFVKVQGVKYSILQCVQERLVATNFGKQGHLVGAATSDGSYRIVAYISPDAQGWHHMAYPSIARAVDMFVGGSSISQASTIVPQPGTGAGGEVGGGAAQQGGTAGASVDPALKEEIEGFLQWIKDPDGLAGYISYYLNNNDTDIISKLANVYNEFRRIFNF